MASPSPIPPWRRPWVRNPWASSGAAFAAQQAVNSEVTTPQAFSPWGGSWVQSRRGQRTLAEGAVDGSAESPRVPRPWIKPFLLAVVSGGDARASFCVVQPAMKARLAAQQLGDVATPRPTRRRSHRGALERVWRDHAREASQVQLAAHRLLQQRANTNAPRQCGGGELVPRLASAELAASSSLEAALQGCSVDKGGVQPNPKLASGTQVGAAAGGSLMFGSPKVGAYEVARLRGIQEQVTAQRRAVAQTPLAELGDAAAPAACAAVPALPPAD